MAKETRLIVTVRGDGSATVRKVAAVLEQMHAEQQVARDHVRVALERLRARS